MWIRLLLELIFYFPGTVLHELAHYVAALLLGKAEGFSIIPKKEGDSYVLGSVKSRTRYKVLSSFIALAPIVWWFILLLILQGHRVIGLEKSWPHIHFSAVAKKLCAPTLADVFFLWLFFQLLWAGRPSRQDIKNIFRGFSSFSGLLTIIVAAAGYYFLQRF